MKDNPLISIYMPTWNRQQLAIRAIKSVLRQDYSNWEMIIVDDCSNYLELVPIDICGAGGIGEDLY